MAHPPHVVNPESASSLDHLDSIDGGCLCSCPDCDTGEMCICPDCNGLCLYHEQPE